MTWAPVITAAVEQGLAWPELIGALVTLLTLFGGGVKWIVGQFREMQKTFAEALEKQQAACIEERATLIARIDAEQEAKYAVSMKATADLHAVTTDLNATLRALSKIPGSLPPPKS